MYWVILSEEMAGLGRVVLNKNLILRLRLRDTFPSHGYKLINKGEYYTVSLISGDSVSFMNVSGNFKLKHFVTEDNTDITNSRGVVIRFNYFDNPLIDTEYVMCLDNSLYPFLEIGGCYEFTPYYKDVNISTYVILIQNGDDKTPCKISNFRGVTKREYDLYNIKIRDKKIIEMFK